jgi:DNA invertase Pin-like site-specific DNA recombinase
MKTDRSGETFISSKKGQIIHTRVSTKDQNLDMQLQALRRAGCRQIYQEKVSGVGRARPEFQKMMQQLREDDVLIIWRLDRLARSTKMLLEIIEQLKENGASFKSLTEPWADTM